MTTMQQRELIRYYSMPKEYVGPEAADDLYMMHDTFVEKGRSFGYLLVAGSTAAESGLRSTHLPTTLRHDRLNAAERTWRNAQDQFIYNHAADGWSEAKLLSVPDRVEMQLSFLGLYHDMVDGNVRQETLNTLHERLVSLAIVNLDLHDDAMQRKEYAAVSSRRGLAYELGTILTITRLGCPSLFAAPVPARIDHGAYFPEKTHDVQLIQQSWGDIRWSIPYEVKPTDGKYTKRYESALVRGRVELLMPSSTDPLDLARYMKQEIDESISPQHLSELNEITSRVFRLATDYKSRMALAKTALSA